MVRRVDQCSIWDVSLSPNHQPIKEKSPHKKWHSSWMETEEWGEVIEGETEREVVFLGSVVLRPGLALHFEEGGFKVVRSPFHWSGSTNDPCSLWRAPQSCLFRTVSVYSRRPRRPFE